MPLLKLAHGNPRLETRGSNTGPFGETIAGDLRPKAAQPGDLRPQAALS
jgi:hypothetical protein